MSDSEPIPTAEDREAARKKRARDESLRKARAQKEANRKQRERERKEKEKGLPPVTEALLEAGARTMVKVSWTVAGVVAFVVGGRLTPLTEKELKQGTSEAVPLLRRFRAVAYLLMFLGFPVWLGERATHHFERLAPKQKKTKKTKTDEDAGERGAQGDGPTLRSVQ